MEAQKLCRCIKKVRKTLKARSGSTKEQGAIAVCVKSVLHTRGKTIKKFQCTPKPKLVTQKKTRRGGCACGAGKKRRPSICSCSPDVGDCPRCKPTGARSA